jgi:hypothetical protein
MTEMPEDPDPSFDGPPFDDEVEDWLSACGYEIDGFGYMTDFGRESMVQDGRIRILLEEDHGTSPHPEIPPDRVWAGVLPVPDVGTFSVLVHRVPVLKDFQDLADPEPRPDAWCRLYAARSWEELDELLEGKFPA